MTDDFPIHATITFHDSPPEQPLAKGAPASDLTAREHAAIQLRVPDSGTDWLDTMIVKRNRMDFAEAAMQALIEKTELLLQATLEDGAHYGTPQDLMDKHREGICRGAYQYADALLAELAKENQDDHQQD